MGSSPSPGIPRRSRGRAHRSTPLRGPHPSVLPLTIVSRARAPPELGEAPTPLLAPPLGRRWPADGEPHHCAAMAAGQLALELLQPCHLHYRVRLGKVVTLVVTSSPVTSPTASSRRTAWPPLPQGLTGGVPLTPWPIVSLYVCTCVFKSGCTQRFLRLVFLKGFLK